MGPDLADDSVNGVITSVPLSVRYKPEVTHQAKLLLSFPSPTSVTSTLLLLFVGGLIDSGPALYGCVGVRVCVCGTAMTHGRF